VAKPDTERLAAKQIADAYRVAKLEEYRQRKELLARNPAPKISRG
jgi:hypothetical protein